MPAPGCPRGGSWVPRLAATGTRRTPPGSEAAPPVFLFSSASSAKRPGSLVGARPLETGFVRE